MHGVSPNGAARVAQSRAVISLKPPLFAPLPPLPREAASEEQEEDESLIKENDDETSKEIAAVIDALSDTSIAENTTATEEQNTTTATEEQNTTTATEEQNTTTATEEQVLLELKSGLRGRVSHKVKEVLCDTPFQCKQKVATNTMQCCKVCPDALHVEGFFIKLCACLQITDAQRDMS